MITRIPELQDIIERLERVERQNRRLKRAGAVGIVVAAAIVVIGPSAPTRQLVEAQQFVLKDTNGVTRASWSVEAGRARFSFSDPSRKPELLLDGGLEPNLVLYAGKGHPGILLGMSPNGHPGLIIGPPRCAVGLGGIR
jgi:hypothetical protein